MIFIELLDQIVIELRHQGQPVPCRGRHSQLVQDESEQLSEIEMSIEDESRVDGGLHSAHEPSEQCRLSSARLAGNDDKALAGFNTVTQRSKCLPIKRVCVGKPRIGSDAKRQLCKSKMVTVHTVDSFLSEHFAFEFCLLHSPRTENRFSQYHKKIYNGRVFSIIFSSPFVLTTTFGFPWLWVVSAAVWISQIRISSQPNGVERWPDCFS